MRILLTFIAFLPSIIATPAFPDSQVTESGTNGIITPKDNFKPFGDQPFGDQPFGDQPFGVWPWDSEEEADPRTAPNDDPIYLPLPQDSGDAGIYAPPTEPWVCPPDRPFPLCCDGKSYNGGVETGCSACVSLQFPAKIYFPPSPPLSPLLPIFFKSLISRWRAGPGDGKLSKCNIMLDQFCCGYYYVSLALSIYRNPLEGVVAERISFS